jgi:SHS2 domain-containing protein
VKAGWEILEHTADTGFRVRAGSFPTLLEQAAEALCAVALDASFAGESRSYPVHAEGCDPESLLVNWLNEVLWIIDGLGIAPARIRVTDAAASTVEGVIEGEPRDDDRHPPRMVVKAATYHQLKVLQSADGWLAEVYLDI